MIEINLVPPELKRTKKAKAILGGFDLPLEVVIGLGGGLIILLVFVHIGLLLINFGKIGEHKKLQAKWSEISPDKERIDAVINEKRTLESKINDIKKITEGDTVQWSQKLNILSNRLPRGVWLKKVALTDEMFFIEGSAISRQKQEMLSVTNFTSNLKKDENFLKDFADMDLGSIQRRTIKKIEIADFLITMGLVLEDEEE